MTTRSKCHLLLWVNENKNNKWQENVVDGIIQNVFSFF
jgi:hypothetical protein